MLDINSNTEINTQKSIESMRNIFSYSLTLLVILFFISLLSVGSYNTVKNYYSNNGEHVQSYIESNDFVNTLGHLTSYLSQKNLQGNQRYNHNYESLENIKYYVVNIDKTSIASNIPEVTDDRLQQEMVNSQFYLKVQFDEKGIPEIESSLGNKLNKNAFSANMGRNGAEEYANLEFLYLVPKDVSGNNDLFIENLKKYHVVPQYIFIILGIGAVTILIVTILAFATPYSHQSKGSICRLYNRIFLEFKVLLFGFFGLCLFGGARILASTFKDVIDVLYSADPLFYLLGIPLTFAISLFTYLNIVYLKHVYHMGVREGLLKNTIVGKIMYYLYHLCKKLLRDFLAIDMNQEIQKKLMLVLGINLVVLWIIAASGPLGGILAVIYTVFLFKFLLKFFTKLKTLIEATWQLALGNFSVKLDEDLGVFSSIAANLKSIKNGFKLAVEKETASQKMKTDLISNVSHDLKTPLTSIITYVDLLKKEDVDSQTRKEYIDILDKKSQRLKVLIEDLFEASKASSGSMELTLENLDVIALFRQTLGELEEKINQSNLQIRASIPENKIICPLDGRRTYRIFENILSNIFKYAMPKSRVYIEVIETEEKVSFIFKNISAYEMNFDANEITERFTRGDKSRNTDGSGLGLAIAKSLIELQEGLLDICIDGDLFKLTVTFNKI